MRQAIVMFLLSLFCAGMLGAADGNAVKRGENERIIDALGKIHRLNLNEDANPNTQNLKTIVDGIEDPRELARLMVVAYYFSYPGDAQTTATDDRYRDLFEIAGMLRMEALSDHENFDHSLQFIANAVRLDARSALVFRNLVVKTKGITAAREMFPAIIRD